MSCLTDTRPSGGEINCMMTRLYPRYEIPQFRESAAKKWEQMDPGTEGSVQSLCRVQLFVTPCTTARQASLSITNCQSLPKPMSIDLVMPSNHLIFCRPLLLPPSICPSIKVFSNELALCIRWSETRCTSLELQLELEAIFSDFRATAVSVRSGSQHPFIQQLY